MGAALPATLAGLGGFFTLPTDVTGLVPLRAELGPDAVRRRLDVLHTRLAAFGGLDPADTDPKVAASALQVGLVSRLWSITLAAVVGHGVLVPLRVDDLWCGAEARNPVPLALDGALPTVPVPTEGALLDAVAEEVLPTAVAIGDAARAVVPVGAQVLRSNAASALVSAARVLGRERPDLADRARAVAATLGTLPWLTGGATGWEDPTGPGFRRRGCCLYYRLPGHGLCPDCVLETAPAR